MSFYQLQTFSSFSAEKEMTDGYRNIINAMQNLRSTADQGSFTKVTLKIPTGWSISVFTNDTVIIEGGSEVIANQLEFDVTYVSFGRLDAGTYNIEVFYGNLTGQPEPYTIYFV